jgi:hypothetical protein
MQSLDDGQETPPVMAAPVPRGITLLDHLEPPLVVKYAKFGTLACDEPPEPPTMTQFLAVEHVIPMG